MNPDFDPSIGRATQFKPGAEWQGNGNGRPKSVPIEDLFRELLDATEIDGQPVRNGRQVAYVLAKSTLADALKGDAKARREIFDRVYGKVPLRIAGPDGGPIFSPEAVARAVMDPVACELACRLDERLAADSAEADHTGPDRGNGQPGPVDVP